MNTLRGPAMVHIMVRLADDGVPIRTIANGFLRTTGDIRAILQAALDRGEMNAMPADDWPVRGSRIAALSEPFDRYPVDILGIDVATALMVPPQAARFIATLYLHGKVGRSLMERIISRKGRPSDKLMHVIAHRARKALAPIGISFLVHWGAGISMDDRNRDVMRAWLAERGIGAAIPLADVA